MASKSVNMASNVYQLANYKRFLLNRMTCSSLIMEYIENCFTNEEESANHTFHMIMVHDWTEGIEQLCDAVCDYYGSAFIPMNGRNQKNVTTFYTTNLHLILKIIKFDFIFPFNRNMYNVDILFNEKNSFEFFGTSITIEDIVSRVVSNRFSEEFELNLSDFCNDNEFIEKKLQFYKVNLLAQFKILMLRMGKDTKLLNLSYNNLSQPPLDILNFFIKGGLVAINLSYNNIPSISELKRVSSKIEKLWIEGNPLCEDLDASSYVKNILLKFPRLLELDGIKIKQHGIMFPFHKTFLATPDNITKMVVEKFLTLYFTHYDDICWNRSKINNFYENNATLSINTALIGSQKRLLPHLVQNTRNILDTDRSIRDMAYKNKTFVGKTAIVQTFNQFPVTVHDPTTFTVDVLTHDKNCLIIIVEGIYKEVGINVNTDNLFRFRRTFVFNVRIINSSTCYRIINEIYSISFATEEQKQNSFKHPIRNLKSLCLTDPDENDVETITNLFSHFTNLKTSEALLRLKAKNWNIEAALIQFTKDLRGNCLSQDKFTEDDDFSDISSLMDEIE